MIRFPYICIVTRNHHSHHPPPPTRLPKDIADDVMEVLQQGDVLGMTMRMYSLYSAYAANILSINRIIFQVTTTPVAFTEV